MTYVDWRLRGPEIATCNCNWGCPCQFNALPSNGNCRAAIAMQIDEGYFGDVRLDGLRWAGLAAWPGALHEGHGEMQPVIDERATPPQREALLKILSGAESQPGATIFSVLAAVVEKVYEPLFKRIDFKMDMSGRTASFLIPGLVESSAEPIRNPVTGEPHFARLVLPRGFEYDEAEFASSTAKARGPVPLEWMGRHAHLAILDLGPLGPRH